MLVFCSISVSPMFVFFFGNDYTNSSDYALMQIYAYAVKESLANVSQKVPRFFSRILQFIHFLIHNDVIIQVYGHRLGSFATSFERSFNTTLRTLVEINDSAFPDNLSKSEGVSKGDREIKNRFRRYNKSLYVHFNQGFVHRRCFQRSGLDVVRSLRLLRKENHGR